MAPRPPAQTDATPAFAGEHEHPNLVRVTWQDDNLQDHAAHIYLDGELIHITPNAQDRATWARIERDVPRRVQVLLVPNDDPADLARPRPERLPQENPPYQGPPTAIILRSPAAAPHAQAQVTSDSGTTPDFAELWPGRLSRPGFGGVFGEDEFGYDHAVGPGLGRGDLGFGPLGADAHALRYRDPLAPDGQSTLSIAVPPGAPATLNAPTQRPTQAPTHLRRNSGAIVWN